MSYLSFLLASKTHGMSPAAREIRTPKPEIRNDEWAAGFHAQAGEAERALPSGVASMEHWLDLNA